ncbi:STAS domain-containing protein [Flammeovirgaceae bacterium SG7u.111]|nr:STAS domain-containing protein [Flammeovirgaceae bacterium SG7u.132]WPO36941.1 STAS domain-containing protein [Flammeovirgaceae bacterium SG7u.111]
MKYSIEKSEKYTKFILDEEKLDTLKAPRLKSELVTLYQAGTTNMILSLANVKYVDSSGLSAILVANRMSNEVGGFLVLVGVSDHVMKLVKISKLDNVLNILPTEEEAVDAIFLNEIQKDLENEDED